MLKDTEIFCGALVKLTEGYAILIEEAGIPFTYSEDDEDTVLVRQRWLIEWAAVERCGMLMVSERLTQASLQGKRTHRNIEFDPGNNWEKYVDIEEDRPKEPYDKQFDDFNGIF